MAATPSHSRKILALSSLLLLASPWLLISCSEEDGLPPPPCCLALVIEQMPEALPAGYALFFPIVLKTKNGDPSGIDSLTCEMFSPQGELYTTFHLYDDGSAYDHVEGSDFLGLRSGDNVPGDGHFTRQISGLGFSNYGVYYLRFSAPEAIGREDSIEIRPVIPPSFVEVTPVVTEFPSGFAPVEYVAHIQKPTTVDRIDSVALAISTTQRPPETLRTIPFVAGSADTLWTLALMPSHFWGIATNLYNFYFILWDRFGLSADTLHRFISISNGVPSVLNSTLPDTIWRPRPGEPIVTTFVTVQASDSESLLDIAEVLFDVHREGQSWSHSPDFFLCDEGDSCEFGDEVAGDGIYSVTLATDSSETLKDNVYYFRFYAKDKTGQQGDYLPDSVRVIERPVVLAVVDLQTRNGE